MIHMNTPHKKILLKLSHSAVLSSYLFSNNLVLLPTNRHGICNVDHRLSYDIVISQKNEQCRRIRLIQIYIEDIA